MRRYCAAFLHVRPVLAVLLLSSVALATDDQTIRRPRPKTEADPVFSAATGLVLVPVTVMDRRGATVTGLKPDVFRISEDNLPQRIAAFGEQDEPVSIGIVFDGSGSMRGVLRSAKDALHAFVSTANPEDEAGLTIVSTRPALRSGYTRDLESLPGRLLFSQAAGSTALVDSIYAAILQTRDAHNPRKALLVISDGMDNHSRYSKKELLAAALEADVQIYSMAIYDPPLTKKPIELAEEREGLSFLSELSRRTGGVSVVARGADDIVRAAIEIGRAMRDQYLIGYVPEALIPAVTAVGTESPDERWHRITVGLSQAGMHASARPGFFSR